MKAGAGTFTDGKEAGDDTLRRLLNLAKLGGGNPSHMIVVARSHGTEFLLRIDIHKGLKKTRYFLKFYIMYIVGKLSQIYPDMLYIMIGI